MKKTELLSKDIATWVEPSKMVKAFHANTIMQRILKGLEAWGASSREGWNSLMDWTEGASFLSGLLPEDWRVMSAKDGSMVNPFRGIQEAFPPKYNKDIASISKAIVHMHHCCLGRAGNDHLNMMEIMEDCGLVTCDDVKDFSCSILGHTQSPKEAMEDFILEMEGANMLGEVEKIDMEGKTLYKNKED
jgi:hypothetical protein